MSHYYIIILPAQKYARGTLLAQSVSSQVRGETLSCNSYIFHIFLAEIIISQNKNLENTHGVLFFLGLLQSAASQVSSSYHSTPGSRSSLVEGAADNTDAPPFLRRFRLPIAGASLPKR